MAGGNAIRGSRVGAGPMGEAERGEAAGRSARSPLTVLTLVVVGRQPARKGSPASAT